MKYSSWINLFFVVLFLSACGGGGDSGTNTVTATEVEVGKLIFEDTRLSLNMNQSCASCHAASAGFADPDVTKASPVSEGSITGEFGNRNAPTSAYSMFSPSFGQTNDPVRGLIYEGGQFLDGRRDTLEEQAKDPFTNPVEMANPAPQAVVNKVRNGPYADKFMAVYGSDVFNDPDPTVAFDRIAEAIAAFERSNEMSPFTSKFDCYTQNPTLHPLSISEKNGLDIFNDPNGGKCSSCHTSTPDPVSGKILFTNFQHINIGVPSNPDNPANKANASFVDLGLGGRLSVAAEEGKFKTPTLRNIELTAPYMHNGVYDSLHAVIQHYDIDIPDGNITPEVIPNIATELEFDTFNALGLSMQDYLDLEAFMKTLTDGTGVGICF